MPAAAVTPAPVAYIKVVAVKKLVVGFLARRARPASFFGVVLWHCGHPSRRTLVLLTECGWDPDLLL